MEDRLLLRLCKRQEQLLVEILVKDGPERSIGCGIEVQSSLTRLLQALRRIHSCQV